jgi:sec-independent protein translocase protein TatB
MFDFGWAEILIVGAIALFVIGPQDIPKIAYSVGKFFRRIKYMQYAITGQFDDFMKSVEDNEAQADAELLNMMPLPSSDPSLREGETDDAIQENLDHEDTGAQKK